MKDKHKETTSKFCIWPPKTFGINNKVKNYTYSQNSVAGVVAFAEAVQLDDTFFWPNSTQDSEGEKIRQILIDQCVKTYLRHIRDRYGTNLTKYKINLNSYVIAIAGDYVFGPFVHLSTGLSCITKQQLFSHDDEMIIS